MSSKFHNFSTAREVVEGIDLTGKNAIVTGGAGGIGVETCRALALQRARVFVAARSKERATPIIEEIKASTKNDQVEFLELDLGSLKSAKKAAEEFLAKKIPLHILINNAGIMAGPEKKTEDGIEEQFGTNHLAHFLFTVHLIPALKAAAPSRVVCLSSVAHKRGTVDLDDINFEKTPYNKWISYARSKSANAIFGIEFNRRYASQGIISNSVHPGGIMTGLQKDLTKEEMAALGWLDEHGNTRQGFKNVEQGASTSTWAATNPCFDKNGGHYLEDCKIAVEADPAIPYFGYFKHIFDADVGKRLWTVSEDLIKEKIGLDVKQFE